MTDRDDSTNGADGSGRPPVGKTNRRTYLGLFALSSFAGPGAAASSAANDAGTADAAVTPEEVATVTELATADQSATDTTPASSHAYGQSGYGEGMYGGTAVPSYLLQYVDNGTGRVENSGLQDAIDDWRNDALDVTKLREVIDYWETGQQVV